VPIRGFIKGTDKFPIQKCEIFRKFKEIKELRGGILLYAAQAIPPIDAEIAGKGHLWTETNYLTANEPTRFVPVRCSVVASERRWVFGCASARQGAGQEALFR
jgi:hypothetical protein